MNILGKLLNKSIEKDAQDISNEAGKSLSNDFFIIKKRKIVYVGYFLLIVTSLILFLLSAYTSVTYGVLFCGVLLLCSVVITVKGICRKIIYYIKKKKLYVKGVFTEGSYKLSDIESVKDGDEGKLIIKMKNKKKVIISFYWDENYMSLKSELVRCNKLKR